MDDVFVYLYNEFYKKGKNYTPEDYQKICEIMAGKSLEDFFAKYVRGKDEIDYDSILNEFGLKLVKSNRDTEAFMGANLSQQGERLNVTNVPAGTPAYEYGLNAGDQIVAIDGYRASQQFLQDYLSEKKPGDKVKLTVFRFDRLIDLDITLGSRPPGRYRIVPIEKPNERQKTLYRNYFGESLIN